VDKNTLKDCRLFSLVSFGNTKLPRETVIFNMGPAKTCPSDSLGLCKVSGKCYAKKAEILYPQVLPYRLRQEKYWLSNSIETLKADFKALMDCKRKKPTKLRLNEAGDFYSQDCIEKAEQLARFLKETYNIVTYTYTSRSDLDFSSCKFLLVKGSGHGQGNNGKTAVIPKNGTILDGFVMCPGSCKKCSICSSDKGINVVFKMH
jgi:hypothetical protein